MTTTKSYDYLNRLTQIASTPTGSGAAPVSFNYNYNSANQRTKNVLADGSYWVYGYDSLGQVASGQKYFNDGTPVPGQQFGYSFDNIGNRIQTLSGGDQTGGNQRVANYTVNDLNQITSRDYPGTNDVVGAALATNVVTVNGQTAWRKGEYFWSTVKTNNASSAQWLGVAVASGGWTNNGHVYMPQTPEQFSYDADGNLTNDGRWAYVWDAENRLVQMTVNTNVGPQYQLLFAYDANGRKIQKLVSTNNGAGYVGQYTNNFLYDGWNLAAILNPQSSILESFRWGSGLSGSQQGAGGVGGLLGISYNGSSTTNCFPAFDGNGNVAALVNSADGTIAAIYEYGPFGEVIRATGPMAKINPFTFGTFFYDWETDKSYAKNRYYDPSTGRFLNRDPMAEPGFELIAQSLLSDNDPSKVNDVDGDGPLGFAPQQIEGTTGGTQIEPNGGDYEWNRYAFVLNRPTMAVDALGLDITVETGNAGAGPINNRVHQQICVMNCNMEKQCFSFGMTGPQWPEFSRKWLGWNSWVTGAILQGEIYQADPVPGATIYSRHTTTAAQDAKWLQYELTTRLGLKDGYSVARHNCRTYSQWEFRDAPLHW